MALAARLFAESWNALIRRAGSHKVAKRHHTRSQPVPTFLIHTPNYSHMHSGIRCLFLLCHHLNRLGYRAFVTGSGAPAALLAPHADAAFIARRRQKARNDIMIYPEITAGNPHGFRRVVRYLLNKQRTPFGPDDFVLHYADEFQTAGLPSRLLWIPLLDRAVFHPRNAPRERSGFLVYSVRHAPDLAMMPDWVQPHTLISKSQPRDPLALADLYRRSRALITWERTAAIGEAMFCGCPVILVPNPTLELEPIVRRTFGFGFRVGWDERGLGHAARTVPLATALYRMRASTLSRNVHRFVREVTEYFFVRDARQPHPLAERVSPATHATPDAP